MKAGPTLPTLVRLDRGWIELNGHEAAGRRIDGRAADGFLLEWGDHPAGLFELMGRANAASTLVLPARWQPARPFSRAGFADPGRLLWVARSDAALTRLLSDLHLGDDLDGAVRASEPLALLGVPGDVVRSPHTDDPRELRRRAAVWVAKLGADRVAVARSTPDDPLLELAWERGLPVLCLADADAQIVPSTRSAQAPILWTDFQLDREHRLPDDTYIPGLRDLLHRGSLLRERCLYDRLPASWRAAAEDEMRALYSWHVSPLLRRVTALSQTLAPVVGVDVQAPLPPLAGVCAYLLGLTDRRLPSDDFSPDASKTAAALAGALQEWDRRLVARVQPRAWPRLRARLAPWVEGGYLASCPEAPSHPGRRFCFSGQPLWNRVPLRRDGDGAPCVDLRAADRRALGWFDLELQASTQPVGVAGSNAGTVQELSLEETTHDEQLDLGLEAM